MPRTVVVTGASSGMGRATALALATRGDRVVVAARRRAALDELAAECERAGGRALAVPTDVTDDRAVEDLARAAVAEFGGFDAWANCAAVQSFGLYWELPARVMRRVVEVNLVGSMHVAKAALDHFRERDGGTLVLVSSILSKTPMPYLNVYNASKHGVAGLATSLRTELKMTGLDERIHVVNLMPPSTDTPFFAHAANYVGQVPRPPEPMHSAEALAEAIVDAIDRPRDEIVVGAMAKLMRGVHAVAPGAYEELVTHFTGGMFTDEPAPPTEGNLFEPMDAGAGPDGGWREGRPVTPRGVERRSG